MDHEDARHLRRAEHKRHVRRRRLAAAGMVGALLAVALVLISRGDDRAAPPVRHQATLRTASIAKPVVNAIPIATMPGAHLAPDEPVPILMYHVIGVRPASAPNPTLWVTPTEFTAHVKGLRKAGYHAVTLRQVWDAWHHGAKLPRKPVVLSFDDGYGGQVRYALPTLAKRGWPGVLNLELHNLKDTGGTRAVRRMVRAGWEIDSHTLTHPDLTTVSAQQLRRELVVSRARLKRYFHQRVSFFCYPSGKFDATVVAAVKAAGYKAATTTQLGWARPGADPFALPRVRIDAGMSPSAVLARVREAR
jgi:peptidoglycan/xylan/chitin deacetylase (PgdA/CDA1 family)